MAWSYCKCGHGLMSPSVEEVAKQSQPCPECGYENDPLVSVAELLVQMNERIQKLEDAQ